ncbi:MAG: M23 family metallopeptidase, partial [Chloroflexota bacterium]|nr:M23 family metallopeptidase [Chloroflexota bacterium]
GGRGTVGAESSPVVERFSTDGTLIKPFAVDTTVPTIADQLRTYTVREGDSLSGIAARFGVSTMTLWWANRLKGKDELSIGQKILIPPADGILYTVKEGDTLASVGREYHVAPRQIVEFNELEGTVLVLGQVLLLPGGTGDPIPVPAAIPAEEPVLVARRPAPDARPSARTDTSRVRAPSEGRSGAGSESVRTPRSTATTAPDCRTCSFGGAMSWPVAGGHISQYFHSGHYGLDIAAHYGSPVTAAAPGKVIFAGWRSNGGGYQVWISHGRNLYTTYNHMSSLTVASGAMVGRGQRVGRIGATGWATGPHLHFEVWNGPIWSGGSRVNPLKYL